MPGARLRNTELALQPSGLAEYVLSGIAFTTSVARREDIGHDLYCALTRYPVGGRMILAGTGPNPRRRAR